MQVLNYINNDFMPSGNRSFFNYQRPFDSQNLQVANSSALDLVQAIQSANLAFQSWKDSTIEERLQLLEKIYAYINEHKIQFATEEALDQGLGLSFTLEANIEMALSCLLDLRQQLLAGPSHQTSVLPVGIVGVLLSWNLSTRLFVEKVLPAIFSGNAVIVKLSSGAPSTATLWGGLFHAVGLPKGLVQILHSQDKDFRQLFISHPSLKALIVTGHLDTAASVMKSVGLLAGQQIKKIQIHSGSKNTTAILKELNEQQMHEVFQTFMQGQGQLVWNSSRLFVLEKFEKDWVNFLSAQLNALKPSQGITDQTMWTPLAKFKSVENFQTIIAQAQKDQAKIISTNYSGLLEPRYVKPFFTKDMSNCSLLQQDQVLGPAFILSTVKYPFDIPKLSNVSYYGHSANIWTEEGKSQKVIQHLDVGLVSMNKWSLFQNKRITGVKQTLFGQGNSQIFGDFYSNVKNISE